MYLPYLRGKQFELDALLEVSPVVYNNTTPIIEPITYRRRQLSMIGAAQIPIILITNPFYPTQNRLNAGQIDSMIDGELHNNQNLTLGYLIDSRLSLPSLHYFINSRPNHNKALIFRHNPAPGDLRTIQQYLVPQVTHLIFDQQKTSVSTQSLQNGNASRVLLTDGFQREERNADYPVTSYFDSIHSSYINNGWSGIGDYLTIGDHFTPGGGQPRVVTLHVTRNTPGGIHTHHFSSTTNSNIGGLAAVKFAEANQLLVTNPNISLLNSTGLGLFRSWHANAHNPQLGAAKKASIIHHIELLSGLV